MKKYLFVLVAFVMILSCFFGKTLVMASEEESGPVYERYYTNIEVKSGDSLWTIAKTYHKNSGMDTPEYISEVKKMNGLLNDNIEAGSSLTIVYFAEAPGLPQ